jgi:CBS domain-containing protein
MTRTVKDLIANKPLICTVPDKSVRETAQLMLDKGVSAVVVLEAGKLLGIFSERDALRIFVATRRNADLTNVGTVMTRDPVTIPADTTITAAKALMAEKNFRHLPVIEGDTVLGVVSLRAVALD